MHAKAKPFRTQNISDILGDALKIHTFGSYYIKQNIRTN